MGTKQFGTKIRDLRKQAGLTEKQLADQLDVSFTYICKIETGAKPPPSEKIILEMADILHAERDELMLLAGRIPSDVVELLKNEANLRWLRSQSRTPGNSIKKLLSFGRSRHHE